MVVYHHAVLLYKTMMQIKNKLTKFNFTFYEFILFVVYLHSF